MKTFKHIVLAFTALLLVASCAIDEMWEGVDTQDEEKVLTFRPKFEDFESVTKAIGDASNVNELLVQVYEQGKTQLISSEVYEKKDWGSIAIPFYYGKKYEVYFWAYNYEKNPYTIGENGLKAGVSVAYPDGDLSYDALENLDAFYAIKEIDLSSNDNSKVNVSLTRPFAQVNLVADKAELETAKATKVEFTIDAADSFVPGGEARSSQSRTFTFKDENFFKNNEEISEGKAYLGTTYLFVPSSGSLEAKVTLYDSMDNKLKGPSTVTIPIASNQRTNLVFTGVEPAWDDDAMNVPEISDGWIHIETPEQMAAFLLEGPAEGAKVHVCLDINMGGLPQKYHEAIAARTFTDLTLYGGALESGNPVGGGSHMISNFTAPAFLANATGLTVSNLVLDNFNVEGNGHVGTLVNTLKGSSTFTNVTVSNSSATTSNGAAGGIVGYIERIAPTTRSEVLNVTFANCQVNGASGVPVAAGSDAEGKFVGLLNGYDYGETLTFDSECAADVNTAVADYVSSYTSQNQSCFLTATESKYDQYLGSESNRRGTVNYGTQRIVPKWDGTTSVKPFFEDSKEMVAQIYSPFDLAYLQGKTLTTLRFKSDVDLAGVCDDCRDGNGNSTKANDDLSTCIHCKPFEAIVSLNNLYGENHILYNLFVQGIHECSGNAQDGRSFIRHTEAGNFENFTFDGAVIKCIDDIAYRNNVELGGNAYAGTLTSRVNGKMTITNVHSRNGHVIGISKFGGLIGTVNGGINATNCSVENYIIENHRINVTNSYSVTVEKTFAGIPAKAECSENFYTEGESGGFIGFIKSNSTITNCHTRYITMKCYGQDDRNTKIACYTWGKQFVIFGKEQWNKVMDLPYTIAGRHNNAFIGDIRTPSSNVITITDCTTSNNTYVEGYDADYYGVNGYSPVNNNEIVGCVYFVGKDMEILGKTLHAGDYKGTVTINGESMPFIGG